LEGKNVRNVCNLKKKKKEWKNKIYNTKETLRNKGDDKSVKEVFVEESDFRGVVSLHIFLMERRQARNKE